MIAPRLDKGGTIGLCAPSHVADRERYRITKEKIESLGYRVVEGENMYKDTYGYLASPEERAADIHQLFADPDVQVILFGGGEGAGEILPHLDFDLIRRHPKRVCSYSDGTSILNPIWAKTGLVTYYGAAPRIFDTCTDYDMQDFDLHILQDRASMHLNSVPWQTLCEGEAKGVLVGGYARNFALLLGSSYCPFSQAKDYVLFVEDHEMFGGVDYVSAMLSHMEQSVFFSRVKGLLFGHYANELNLHLLDRLRRLGEKYRIPVAYCDDFGHSDDRHAILEIGRKCILDTEKQTLLYV